MASPSTSLDPMPNGLALDPTHLPRRLYLRSLFPSAVAAEKSPFPRFRLARAVTLAQALHQSSRYASVRNIERVHRAELTSDRIYLSVFPRRRQTLQEGACDLTR